MTVMVTGGAGFIGQHLINYFNSMGHTGIIAIDKHTDHVRKNLLELNTFIELNLNDYDSVEKVCQEYSVDEVVHLAANSDIQNGALNSEPDFRDTLGSSLNLSELTNFVGIKKIFFASSSAIFGVRDFAIKKTDSRPKLPISYYGMAKLASEKILSSTAQEKNIVYQCLRFPNVVGPNLTHGLLFDLKKKIERDPKTLKILGNGFQSKPFMHVEDLTKAIYNLWISNLSTTENIGPVDNITVREIVQLTCNAFNVTPDIYYETTATGWIGDVPHYSYENYPLWFAPKDSIRTSKQSITNALEFLPRN
jgi:UDP-glucose 4-epimerase